MANVRKYIIIPEYKPLYAMRKCFGPTHGPLTKPCPTPIDIIGELLIQKDRLTIFEVKKLNDTVFSDPIQLTVDNYKLPYDVIVAGGNTVSTDEDVADSGAPVSTIADAETEIQSTPSESEDSVAPDEIFETNNSEDVCVDTDTPLETEDVVTIDVEDNSEKVAGAVDDSLEILTSDNLVITDDISDSAAEDYVTVNATIPEADIYTPTKTHMTKAERRAARRNNNK